MNDIIQSLRAHLIILDGLGIGALPDADEYNDQGSNTLGNLAEKVGGLEIPHLQALGLGNIAPLKGVQPVEHPFFSLVLYFVNHIDLICFLLIVFFKESKI